MHRWQDSHGNPRRLLNVEGKLHPLNVPISSQPLRRSDSAIQNHRHPYSSLGEKAAGDDAVENGGKREEMRSANLLDILVSFPQLLQADCSGSDQAAATVSFRHHNNDSRTRLATRIHDNDHAMMS
jgi:hypothetical protein